MKYIIPTLSGFCHGMQEAVQNANDNCREDTYALGNVANNQLVNARLIANGLQMVEKTEEIPNIKGLRVLTRPHGITEKDIREMQERGYEVIDGTCSHIVRIYNIVKDANKNGMDVIIIGNSEHPEIQGIVGHCDITPFVIKDLTMAKATLPNLIFSSKGVCLVAQTTYNSKKYAEIYEYCKEQIKDIKVFKTVCGATEDRQTEIRKLSKKADGVIIVGGKNSSNVSKLANIAGENCDNVWHIESYEELELPAVVKCKQLVIGSGASTDIKDVDKVKETIGDYCKQNNIPFEPFVERKKECSLRI